MTSRRRRLTAQQRFDRARAAMEAAPASEYEYDIDVRADELRVTRDGSTYTWTELPEHVRDYWREQASR